MTFLVTSRNRLQYKKRKKIYVRLNNMELKCFYKLVVTSLCIKLIMYLSNTDQ